MSTIYLVDAAGCQKYSCGALVCTLVTTVSRGTTPLATKVLYSVTAAAVYFVN